MSRFDRLRVVVACLLLRLGFWVADGREMEWESIVVRYKPREDRP